MEWAQQRKIMYALGFAVAIILLAAYPVYTLVKQTPTCSDNKKNGTETGVDCGGGCALICVSDIKTPRIVWVKAFPINGSTYDIGAYVENTNASAGVKKMRYTLRVLDSAGQVLTEKTGATELAPSSATLIFETGIKFSGAADHTEIVLNGDDLANWQKASVASSVVLTKNQSLMNTDTKPRFDAVLVNTDPIEDVTNLTLGAVIYDVARNPVAVSRTYVDRIQKGGEQNIFFTWPNHFTKYARGERCAAPVDMTMATSSTSSAPTTVACPQENFITEIVVTPRAIFAN